MPSDKPPLPNNADPVSALPATESTLPAIDDLSVEPAPLAEYDTPWKIALEHHFEPFMAFYFPRAHAQIDWTIPHEFLDKELQAITKDALVGTRHVDKLVKVQRLSGEEDWIFIHIEVQVARVPRFAERMYVYNYRIFDRYVKPVASMAVLGDDDPNWLPREYAYEALDCEIGFRFPVAKLAHYADQEAALELNPNPFALLTLAYLHTRATRSDMTARFAVKCRLIRMLYARKWEGAAIREFLKVIDWMMALPPGLESKLNSFVGELEEEKRMEYVTSIERVRLAQLRESAMNEGSAGMLARLVTRRFGALPDLVQQRIQSATLEQLEAWSDRFLDARTLDEVFQDLPH